MIESVCVFCFRQSDFIALFFFLFSRRIYRIIGIIQLMVSIGFQRMVNDWMEENLVKFFGFVFVYG